MQYWLEESQLEKVSDEDPEVKKMVKVECFVLSGLQKITSSWIMMKRIMTLILVIKGVWLHRIGKVSSSKWLNDNIDTKMIQKAEEKILFLVSPESFANEIKQLKSKKVVVLVC